MTTAAASTGVARRYLPMLVVAAVAAGSLFLRGGGGRVGSESTARRSQVPAYSEVKMDVSHEPPLNLLFLHHSVGAHLLSDPGPDDSRKGTHPNGGGLRRALTARGFSVHEATYGSRFGEHTDLFDWNDKFSSHMDELLRLEEQDRVLPPGSKNSVVLFKSCFPNNAFTGPGASPGSGHGPELTVANAQVALRSLLPTLERHPETLFVYLTAPPLAPVAPDERAYKLLAKKILGKPSAREKLRTAGENARRFNDWVVAKDGWLAGYTRKNVAVFDYFGILTDGSATGLSAYATASGTDSHPSAAGNQRATEAFLPFLDAAVREAEIK